MILIVVQGKSGYRLSKVEGNGVIGPTFVSKVVALNKCIIDVLATKGKEEKSQNDS